MNRRQKNRNLADHMIARLTPDGIHTKCVELAEAYQALDDEADAQHIAIGKWQDYALRREPTPTEGKDVSSPDYKLFRQQQTIASNRREIRSLRKRIADLEYDSWVMRGNLKDLSEQEQIVLNPESDRAAFYGKELTLDLYGCDVDRFTRKSITEYFIDLCGLIKMRPEDRYFWDDLGVPREERQTDPKTRGTSAVQFILTSTIVIHTLDDLRQAFINVFACKDFDITPVTGHALAHFKAKICEPHVIVRG